MNDPKTRDTVPFEGERLKQHQAWMRVMAEGQLTLAPSISTRNTRLKKNKK